MTNEEIAREVTQNLWLDLPDRETCTPAEWHKAVEPLILKALSAYSTDEAQCEAGMEAKGFHRVLPADVVEVLRECEFSHAPMGFICPICKQARNHTADCKLNALLKKYTSTPSLPAEAIALAYAIIEDAEADRFIYRTHETMMAGTKSYPLAKAVLKKYIPEEQPNETI